MLLLRLRYGCVCNVGHVRCRSCPDLDHPLRLPCPSQVVTAAAELEPEDAEAEQVPATATPREVIEKLSAAKVTLTCGPHLWTGALCLYCAFLTSTKHTLVTTLCTGLILDFDKSDYKSKSHRLSMLTGL